MSIIMRSLYAIGTLAAVGITIIAARIALVLMVLGLAVAIDKTIG